MFIAVIDGIRYIKDVPEELTEKAIECGEIKVGSVLGLAVHPQDSPENQVLIEVKIKKTWQVNAIKKGIKIPLDACGNRYILSEDALEYIMEEHRRMRARMDFSTNSKNKTKTPA
jgi:hypothetical protein